jgi:Asp-tRNA(Asn)/Glu-tRNA(Gln) amidotransferase A subunit family amidase
MWPVDGAAEVVRLTARAAVSRIRNGDLSAEAYARVLLDRLAACRNLNTVSHLDESDVFERARAIDLTRREGRPLGSLAGLPMIIKDNINTVGYPTTAGCDFLANYRPAQNARFAQKLFDAGVVLFGKANMHELAMGSTSMNKVFGPVRNPHDPSRIPGGSSGGTAAAIAAHIVPAGVGTDTSGSCRMPAHFCGIVGFRPSNPKGGSGYSAEGIVPNVLDFDAPGLMTRDVADLALIHSAIAARPVAVSADLRGIRIGVPYYYFWESLDSEVERVGRAALAALHDAGASLVDLDLAALVAKSLPVITTLNAEGKRTDLAAFLAREYPAVTMGDVIAGVRSPLLAQRLIAAQERPAGAEAIRRARAEMDRLGHEYDRALRSAGLDAIVFPAVPVPAPVMVEEGDLTEFQIGGRKYPINSVLQNAILSPLYRAPGLVVPAGVTTGGLSVGLEFDGLAGEDESLLTVGMAAEAVLGPAPQALC